MPYKLLVQVPGAWGHELYEGSRVARVPEATGGAPTSGARGIAREGTGTLLISKLYFGVNDWDRMELFEEQLHYVQGINGAVWLSEEISSTL